ncbi:AraC family transcriptional regulator [Micrococcoides hystricis]|uniref:Helix-turn-helix transcriptional regulator n=1 Tax=Micrococcoides hystricis TaxID=1572761 RepID=A0ABV6PAR2_9MICC
MPPTANASTITQLGPSRFVSSALPRSERIRAWERHNANALVALQAHSAPGQEFAAAGANLALPEMDVARVRCTPHRVARTDADISQHPVDGAIAYLNLDRCGTFWHRGRKFELAPWQLLVVDGDQGFAREFSRGTDEFVFRLSRNLLQQSARQRNLATPQIFDGSDQSATAALIEQLRTLASAALTDQRRDWDGLQEKAGQLLGGLLGSAESDQLTQARGLIQRHHRNPRFRAEDLAAALGVSTRQLTRIFASGERTVAQELLAVRLETAHRALSEPQQAQLSVGAIAVQSGFASQAHFTRCYRAAYGVTPLRHRRELIAS